MIYDFYFLRIAYVIFYFLSFIWYYLFRFLFFLFLFITLHKKILKIVQKEIFHVCTRSVFSSYLRFKKTRQYESRTNLLYSNFRHRWSLVSIVLCVPSFGLHFIEALVFPRWRVTQVKLSFEGDSFLSFFWFL